MCVVYSQWLARATGSTKCRARAQVAFWRTESTVAYTPTPLARALAGDLVNDFRETHFTVPAGFHVQNDTRADIPQGKLAWFVLAGIRRPDVVPLYVSRWPKVVRSTGGRTT